MEADQDGNVLGPIAEKLGVPTDMEFSDNSMELERALIFFGGEGFCLICAILYYKYLPPNKVNVWVRHLVAMLLGITVGFFSFGTQFFHVVAQSVICFTAISVLPQSYMHIVVFMIAMSYLVILHLYRAFMIPEDVLYSIDVSGPLMIVTQKISSLAFSIHDGCYGNKDKLSDLQKRWRISKPPSTLEYFSYVFYFQGVVVGPLSFFKDYNAYIEGTDIATKTDKNGQQNNNVYASQKLSPFRSVFYKMLIAIFWMCFHFTMKPLYPEMLNADPEFIRSHGILYRFWYMLVSMLCCRAKYYVAFTLGDAICNASGFGFNGYDKNGLPKWNLVTNVYIWGIEGATSIKLYLDNWNIQTSLWLRLVCYDRIPVQKRFATFLLSAVWHGCYPGYYFTFISGVPLSEAARKVRRKIRPYFQRARWLQILYDVMTWLMTHLMISYIVVPFTILHLRQTLTFFTYNMYWSLHIVMIMVLIVIPYIPTPASEKPTLNPSQDSHINGETTDVSNSQQALSNHKRIQ